jgi:methylenetetrahydrofolate dehydrogenase (NADP+)/methenyltetrahydrofolate cyclohydrolase
MTSPLILDGKLTAQSIKDELKNKVSQLTNIPKLVVILVGDDPASATYVRNKEKACEYIGIKHETILLPPATTEEELLVKINEINKDPTIQGLLVQLPVPKHIDEKKIINAINPDKDVDGFHPINVGKLYTGQPSSLPCTPAGIIALLDFYNLPIAGKHAVVVGRSNIVGKPVATLLLQRDATVTICHSRTPDLSLVTKQADILVVAVGKPAIITGSMVKEGAVVIDVGTNWVEVDGERKLVGDVDFATVAPKTSAISPVPGGVGPMTIAILLTNCITASGK